MTGWALDLGTTNTGIARWDETGQPQLVELPGDLPRARRRRSARGAAPGAVGGPTCSRGRGSVDRLGAWPPLERLVLLGARGADRPARARAQPGHRAIPRSCPTFKAALSTRAAAAARPRRAGSAVTRARGGARVRARAARRGRSARPGGASATWSSPCRSTPTRATARSCSAIAAGAGVRRRALRRRAARGGARLRPGPRLASARVLVVDIGGGTMHVALVRARRRAARSAARRARCSPSRAGRSAATPSTAGSSSASCRRMGLRARRAGRRGEMRLWRRLMLAEACRVKEALFFERDGGVPAHAAGRSARRVERGTRGARPRSSPATTSCRCCATNGFYAALDGVHRRASSRTARAAPLAEARRRRAAWSAARRSCPASSRSSRSASAAIASAPGSRSRRSPTAAPCFAADRVAPARLHRPRLRLRHARPEDRTSRATRWSCRAARASRRRPTSGSGSSCPPARSASRRRCSSSWSARSGAATAARATSSGTRPATSTRSAATDGRTADGGGAAQRGEPDARLPRPAALAARPPAAARDRVRRERRPLAGGDGARPADADAS